MKIRTKIVILSGATILSSLAVSVNAQEPAPCSAHNKTAQQVGIQNIVPAPLVHSALLVTPASDAGTLRPPRHVSVSPPLSETQMVVGRGSISPLESQPTPFAGQQAGGVEPIFQKPYAEPTEIAPVPVQVQLMAEIKQSAPATMSALPDGWTQVLTRYTSTDGQGLVRFDYAGLQASQQDMQTLTDYISGLSTKSPSTMPRNQAMAYWANLYNALTVQVVAQNYPVKSIREIKSGRRKGPWKRDLVRVEGQDLSLDNIEHDILRPTFKTPLVHYMVNCASVGCPNLKTSPWNAQTLQADMEAAARAYINSERGVKFERGNMQASRIYRWFKKDFGNSETGVIAHLTKYGNEDLRQKLANRTKIDRYGYDWALNAPK